MTCAPLKSCSCSLLTCSHWCSHSFPQYSGRLTPPTLALGPESSAWRPGLTRWVLSSQSSSVELEGRAAQKLAVLHSPQTGLPVPPPNPKKHNGQCECLYVYFTAFIIFMLSVQTHRNSFICVPCWYQVPISNNRYFLLGLNKYAIKWTAVKYKWRGSVTRCDMQCMVAQTQTTGRTPSMKMLTVVFFFSSY